MEVHPFCNWKRNDTPGEDRCQSYPPTTKAMDAKVDLLSMPAALDDDICATSPGTDHQNDLSCQFSLFSEINRVHDPAALSILQPLVCNSISSPHREARIVVVSICHYRAIENIS